MPNVLARKFLDASILLRAIPRAAEERCGITASPEAKPAAVAFEEVNPVLRAEDISAAVHHCVRVLGFRLGHQPTNYPWAYEQVEDIDGNVLHLGSAAKKTNRKVNGWTCGGFRRLGAIKA